MFKQPAPSFACSVSVPGSGPHPSLQPTVPMCHWFLPFPRGPGRNELKEQKEPREGRELPGVPRQTWAGRSQPARTGRGGPGGAPLSPQRSVASRGGGATLGNPGSPVPRRSCSGRVPPGVSISLDAKGGQFLRTPSPALFLSLPGCCPLGSAWAWAPGTGGSDELRGDGCSSRSCRKRAEARSEGGTPARPPTPVPGLLDPRFLPG